MKSDFHVDKNLMQLSEVLEGKEPYAVLVVSTTGLDNKDFDKNSPTRVQLVEYEFDDEIQQYTASITFNKIVAADIEAVDRAIETANDGGYDAFSSAVIDADNYKAQIQNPDLSEKMPEDQRVLSQKEFKQQFAYVMTALEHDHTALIVNGLEHSQKYLDKIECAEQLAEIVKAGKVIDQPSLGGEYLISHGRDDLVKRNSATLENVRNFITPVPNAAKQFDTPEMSKDFSELSKEDFLKAHPKTTSRAYDIKTRDVEFRATKALAPERADIINQLVTVYGREKGILEDERQMQMRIQSKQQHEFLSDRGKNAYKNASLEKKILTQTEMGVINKDAVLSGDSQYHKLMEALSGENGKKGIAIVHVATSGINNPRGNETGLPIQIYIRTTDADTQKEGINANKSKGYCFYMKVPESVVLSAQANTKFDVFKDAGIDVEQYKSGTILTSTGKKNEVLAEQNFIGLINQAFSKEQINPDDYTIISIGGKGDGQAFFQKALESVCNNPIVHAPTIDILQAVTEYSLLTTEGQIPDNVIFGDKEIKGLGIRDIASAVGIELNSTEDKIKVAFAASSIMYTQYLELIKDEREQEQKKPEKEETLDDFEEIEEMSSSAVIRDEAGNIVEAENYEEDADPDFIDEDGYDGDFYIEDDVDEMPQRNDSTREKFEQEGIEEFYEAFGTEFEKSADSSIEYIEEKEERTDKSSQSNNKDDKPAVADRPYRKTEHKQSIEAEHRQSERPQRVTPQETNDDVSKSALLEMLKVQSEMIAQNQQTIQKLVEMNAEQSRIIAQADERLHDALSRQNELLRDIAAMAFNALSPAPARTATQERSEENKKTETLDVIGHLESIKDDLTNISNDVPPNVAKHLREANLSITDGQQEYESPKKTVDNKSIV